MANPGYSAGLRQSKRPLTPMHQINFDAQPKVSADCSMIESQALRDRYLSLMQECLIGAIYQDPPLTVLGQHSFDQSIRDGGRDWPSVAHSMIGRQRMLNLRRLSETVIQEAIPGDFIETGVWRGGSCIMMKAVVEAYGDSKRRVWVADSFAGLPAPNAIAYPMDSGLDLHRYAELNVPVEEVRENFRRYSLLDERVRFLEGWFKDTLPTAPIERLAMLRLDGDLYESTMDALRSLYDKVSPKGFIIVDDYHCFEACKQAVADFCKRQGIAPRLQEIDGWGVFWRKGDYQSNGIAVEMR